jgi:two-component system, cell cycle sensor histidine kinase and response regulator CckA
VDINSLLTQVVDMTKPHWKDRLSRQNIRIQTALHLNKIPKIYASPTALREVFINLVLNAIDALSVKGGGTLSMKTETKEKSFHIIISDSGMGMEKGVLERALEPYFTTKGENGSGLGLSNSVEIVKNLKGTLQIQSEEGKGTTVTIALPLSKKRPKKSLTSQSLTRELSTSKHLLLVDDEEDYRRATAELLAMEGFSVEQAKNAEEALDMLKEMEPEVVLSDVRMPGMSGCDLAIQIKKKNKKTKVILVSGSKEQCKELTKKMDSYVDGWLVKPCMVEDIKQAIEQTCH